MNKALQTFQIQYGYGSDPIFTRNTLKIWSYILEKKSWENFQTFMDNVLCSIFSDSDTPHPYLMKNGIPSLSLEGRNSKSSSPDDISKFGLALELFVRNVMRLEEQLHAGSKLYLPTSKGRIITVQDYYLLFVLNGVTFSLLSLIRYLKLKDKVNLTKCYSLFFVYLFHG